MRGCPRTRVRMLPVPAPKTQSWRPSGRHVALWESARPGFRSTTSWLCNLRQISQPLCALDSPSVGVIVGIERLVEVSLRTGGNREGHRAGGPEPWGGDGAPGDTKLSGRATLHRAPLPLGTAGKGRFCGCFQSLGVEARSASAWAVGAEKREACRLFVSLWKSRVRAALPLLGPHPEEEEHG